MVGAKKNDYYVRDIKQTPEAQIQFDQRKTKNMATKSRGH